MYNKLVQIGFSDTTIINSNLAISGGVTSIVLVDEIEQGSIDCCQVLISDINREIIEFNSEYEPVLEILPKWASDIIAALFYSMCNNKCCFVNNGVSLNSIPDINDDSVFFSRKKGSELLVSCDIIHTGKDNTEEMLSMYNLLIDRLVESMLFYSHATRNIFDMVANQVAKSFNVKQLDRGCING